jgi:hypothetical protein
MTLLFLAFSKQVNVDNIREYETRRVNEAQARAKEAAALETQVEIIFFLFRCVTRTNVCLFSILRF